MYKDKIIKGTAWNFLGTIMMLLIGIGSSVIYVRYLGDQNYGVAVYITDMAIFAVTLCSLGLGTYQAKVLPRLKREGNFSEYKFTLFNNIRIRLYVILALILTICSLNYFGLGEFLSKYGYAKHFLIIYIILQISLAALRGPLQVEYQQRFLNILDISSLIIRLLLVCFVIYLDLGLTGFLVTEVIIEIMKLVLLARQFKKLVWVQIRHTTQTSKQGILSASLPMYFVDLSSKVYGKEYDVFIIGLLLGKDSFRQIAIYSLSFVLVSRAFTFLGLGTANAATLLMNFSSEVIADGKTDLLVRLVEKQFKLLLILVLPIMCGGVLLGGEVLQILYGKEFTEFGALNAVFFIGYGITSISYVSKPILFVIGKERVLLKIRLLLSLVKTLLIIFAVKMYGMLGAAIVTSLIIGISSMAEGIILRKEIKFKIQPIYVAKIIGANLVMSFAIITLMCNMPNITVQDLILITSISAIIYAASLLIFKPLHKEDSEMLNGIGFVNRYKINKILAFITS